MKLSDDFKIKMNLILIGTGYALSKIVSDGGTAIFFENRPLRRVSTTGSSKRLTNSQQLIRSKICLG